MSPVVDRAPHRKRRRVSRAVVAAVVFGLLTPLVVASPASADKIGDMRKQAARMADQLDALENRADDLSENYAEAVYELQELDQQVAQAQSQLDAADSALGQTRGRMRDYAVNAYVQFDQASDLMVFLGSTPENTEARIGYADVAVGKDRALADTFRSASEDAAFARADLQSQREKQNQLQAQVNSAKKDAEQAVSAQQRALSKVQGQLATLVRQEQARRAAEAAKAARARQQQSRSGRVSSSTAGRNVPAPSAGVSGAIAARAQPARRRVPLGGFHAGRGLRLLRPHVVGVGPSGQGAARTRHERSTRRFPMCRSTSCSRATSSSSEAAA